MASRYLVATGDYDSTSVWAATSGGAPGASVPGSADDVYLNADSGASVLTINVASEAKTFIHTGFTGTLAGSAGITVSGNVTFASGATYTYTGVITVNASATVNMASMVLLCALRTIGSGITVTLSNSGTFTYINPNSSSGALTVRITSGNTLTLTDSNPIRAIGTSGNLITLRSVTAYSKGTINCTNVSGKSLCDYLVVTDIKITGSAKIYPGENTDLNNSFGFILTCIHSTAMTANDTPSPVVVSASSENSVDKKAFKAADKDNNDTNCWVSAAGDGKGWWKIDLGSPYWISDYYWTGRNTTGLDTNIVEWTINTSLNDSDYSVSDTRDVANWSRAETRKYTLASPVYCRYIKVQCVQTQTTDYIACAIGEIEFVGYTLSEKEYNSSIGVNGGIYNLLEKEYNGIITFNDSTYIMIEKEYNSILRLQSAALFEKHYNSIIGLKSARLFEKEYNSIISLSNNLYMVLPIYFTIKNSLRIGAEAKILPFTEFTNLPFSGVGGVVS